MSAPAGHPLLRARLAEALDAYLSTHTFAEVGSLLGIERSTVRRRGCDLRDWPADELLILAAQDLGIREALRICATGEQVEPGQPIAVIGDLVEEIADNANINRAIAEAMRDGKISASKASDIIVEIQKRRKHEDEHLLPDLLATVKGR